MSSYRPVDPLTGKPFGMGSYAPKDNLRERLAEQQERRTPEGTFKQGQHGLEFVPKSRLVDEQAAQGVREHNARVLARIRCISAAHAAAQVPELQESYSVLGMTQAELARVAGFDPFTEQLRADDWVEIVGGMHAGKSGYVRHINPETGNPVVWFSNGGIGMCDRINTKLVTKAAR